MFWKSIIEGLAVFGHWQIWIAAIIYTATLFGFMMVFALVFWKNEEAPRRILMGSLSYMVGGIVLEGALMALMIAFLLPILLGGSSINPVSEIISLLWPIVKIGLIAMVAVTILCIIPFIGGLIAHSPGIQTFLEGIIIFRLLSGYAIDTILTTANVQGNVYPGFWACIGFLIIAAVIVRLVMFGMAFLCVTFEDTTVGELIPVVVGSMLGALGGMIPLFMYCSYVRISLMQIIGE